jgi:hypothetical protein
MNAAPSGRRFALWRVSARQLAFAFVVLVIAGCATKRDQVDKVDQLDEFDVHREQALKDSETPEGKAYEREFYPAIGQELADLLNKCSTEFPSVEGDSFEMVFRIDHFGEPKAVMVRPMTEMSECVANGAWYFTYPRPDEKFTQLGVALLVPIKIK